jgi:Tol biopolymer transport system component
MRNFKQIILFAGTFLASAFLTFNFVFASASGPNGKIVFAGFTVPDNNYELYSMNPDGTGLIRLTTTPDGEGVPVWSQDGSKIAYTSGAGRGIWTMNADGSNQVLINNILSTAVSWAPDGRIIYGNGDIFAMNADGSGLTNLTNDPSVSRSVWDLSADGTKVLFSAGDGSLYSSSLDGTNQMLIATTGPGNIIWPKWSPDGSRIVFESTRDTAPSDFPGNVSTHIYVMNADGSNQINISGPNSGVNQFDHSPAWAPDGTKIVFTRNNRVTTMNPDGTGVVQVVNAGNNIIEKYPNWQAKNFTNHPPVISEIDDQSVTVGQTLQFTVTAVDPDHQGDLIALSVSNLPLGASFNSGTGIFSWSPTSSDVGIYSNVTFTATDNDSPAASSSQSITITVNSANNPPVLNPIGDKTVSEGQNLSFTVSATDPDNNNLTYSASNLPTGASFDAGTHTFSWTPNYTQAGTYPNVQFVVTDDGTPVASSSESITITVNNVPPQITTTTLPDPIVGYAYSQAMQSVGLTPPLIWTITNGTLPNGLSLNATTSVISGTPTTRQTKTFTVKVTDANAATSSATLTLNVVALLKISTPKTLPTGKVGNSYSKTLTTSGGTDPDTWSVISGALPDGLSLSSDGVISGMPTVTGTFNPVIQATDSGSQSTSTTFKLKVTAISITTGTVNNGVVGAAYTKNLTATGGVAPYTWTVTDGSLPTGLSLSTSGTISGTPTAAGDFTFTIQASDVNGQTDTATYTTTMTQTHISTASLPNGKVGNAYTKTMTANSGTAPYTWSVLYVSLPFGLSLSSAGVISGTPTTSGTATTTIQATDANGVSDSQTFSLKVNP